LSQIYNYFMSWLIVFNGVRVARFLEICVLWINVFVLYRLGIVLSYWFIIVSSNCIFVTKYIDYWNSRCLIATRRDLTTLVLPDSHVENHSIDSSVQWWGFSFCWNPRDCGQTVGSAAFTGRNVFFVRSIIPSYIYSEMRELKIFKDF
jgi:hypothetical protein